MIFPSLPYSLVELLLPFPSLKFVTIIMLLNRSALGRTTLVLSLLFMSTLVTLLCMWMPQDYLWRGIGHCLRLMLFSQGPT